jgi:large conductance mechanosensitive channel
VGTGVVAGPAVPPCSITSKTMSVNSSVVDPGCAGPGGGGGTGCALAGLPEVEMTTEIPISIPATPANSHRIAFPPQMCVVHSRTHTPRKLALDSTRRRITGTNVECLTDSRNRRKGFVRMLKGFKEFLARGNIVDLSVAVVIGTAFTALVTKFTDSIIQPLINRVGAGKDSDYGILKISIGGNQSIDLNVLLSAAINFVLVAAVVYFLVVVPYNRLRKKGEVEQAQDTELSLLTEIRNILAETPGRGTDTAEITSNDDKT